MSESVLIILTTQAIILIALLVVVIKIVKAAYVKLPQDVALIVSNPAGTKVYFKNTIVYPIISQKEFIKIGLIIFEVSCKGNDSLISKDNIPVDMVATFYLRVNTTEEDVLRVAQTLGAEDAADVDKVAKLFTPPFLEALRMAAKQFDVQDLESSLRFRDQVFMLIGEDLNGYVIEDIAIGYLKQQTS